MHNIKISPKALEDMQEIKGYISQELGNPQAAVNMVSRIMKKTHCLSEYPGIGAPLSSVVDIENDYRFLICANYLIFYRCEGEGVFVVRVLYSRRDYMRILFGSLHEEVDK